ncbi:folate-binding protein YgfZ [Puniceibacterium sp. IMCC21224]|uniref:CAF17-like 4Fe-4S cluster assembly/insertion protein YgfZ n=1 Tax=Puniceibacterium sp. IMCC21224 TaxID=1618204 RepID=UPI00064DD977|nr:folate-binding protein YgfZ [Puniceibacterium sp. IMCC21224]KMK66125.1 folate-binding protein YgfZ [Puniceibacterium sp. IMCC21224]
MTQSDRTILSVSGPDATDFLQGLVTNDVTRLRSGLVYTALLTPQGKYRADFFLVPDQQADSAEGETILIDVAPDLASDLMRALTMYKLRSKVAVTQIDRQVTRGLGTPPDGTFSDPRDPAMGWRGYHGQPGDDDIDWDARRVTACVPASGIELTADTFILEAGFERLNGVDFRKGCYVGQEVTARMKHKTELRKGLAPVTVTGSAPVGTAIDADGKAAGVLYTQSGGAGIAYLRFDRANGPMTAGTARVTRQS